MGMMMVRRSSRRPFPFFADGDDDGEEETLYVMSPYGSLA